MSNKKQRAALDSFEKYDANDNLVGITRYQRDAFYSGEEKALVTKIKSVSKGGNKLLQQFYLDNGIPEGVAVIVNSTGSTTEVFV